VSIDIDFHINVLAAVALDHELRLFEARTGQVVHIDSSLLFIVTEQLRVLPRKKVVRGLICWDCRVQRAELHSVELSIHEGGRVTFLGCLDGEAGVDEFMRLAEIAILVNFDSVGVFGGIDGNQTRAFRLVGEEFKTFDAVFGGLLPLEGREGLTSLGVPHGEVEVGLKLLVILFTGNDEGVCR